jgi:hypothetical protein
VSRNPLNSFLPVVFQLCAKVGVQKKINENSMPWKDICPSSFPHPTEKMILSGNIRPIGTPFADQRKNDQWVGDVEERRFYPH